MGIRHAIAALCDGRRLDRREAADAMRQVLSGEANAALVASYLTALRLRGETAEELSGSADALFEHAVKLPVAGDGLVDSCGTGGDGAGTFNISTAAAFIAAGAGCRVAKHGNRSVSSRCGSADVLEVLGVKIDVGPDIVARCLERAGMGFLFAPRYHPGLKHAMGVRRDLGFRTLFNVLGPICNPARPARQVVGVFAPELMELVGQALMRLGSRHALVIHSSQGLDEATTGGENQVYAVAPGQAQTFAIRPEDHGLPAATPADLVGGSALDNARMIQGILEGEAGARRDAAILNAALVIQVSRDGLPLPDALGLARESIASGRAFTVLKYLRAASHA